MSPELTDLIKETCPLCTKHLMGPPSDRCICNGTDLRNEIRRLQAPGEYPLSTEASLIYVAPAQRTAIDNMLKMNIRCYLYKYPFGPQRLVDVEEDGSVTRSSMDLYMIGIEP